VTVANTFLSFFLSCNLWGGLAICFFASVLLGLLLIPCFIKHTAHSGGFLAKPDGKDTRGRPHSIRYYGGLQLLLLRTRTHGGYIAAFFSIFSSFSSLSRTTFSLHLVLTPPEIPVLSSYDLLPALNQIAHAKLHLIPPCRSILSLIDLLATAYPSSHHRPFLHLSRSD
jgi:hypothetical protein